jgi:methionine aminopeptidase
MSYNQVGPYYNMDLMVAGQAIAKKVIEEVSKNVYLGMNEADGINLINESFSKFGNFKFWHPHKFRIGKNTLLSFKEESDKDVILNNGDIYFIDIGPIIRGHEADFGDTFIFGDNELSLELISKTKQLFNFGREQFLKENITGINLYGLLKSKSSELGVELNLKTLGHRIGDFPHHLFYKGKLAELEFIPSINIWVLEIQIKHSCFDLGSFYEDIIFE